MMRASDPPPAAPRSRGRLAKSVLGNVLMLAGVLVATHLYTTRNVEKGTAPAIAARDLEGRDVRVPAADGRARIVHFFATWCGVCRAEEHNLRALADTGQVVMIASDSGDEARVRAYARAQELTLPIVLDRGALKRAYGVSSYPTTFFVDGAGNIDFVAVGYTTELGLRARLLATR